MAGVLNKTARPYYLKGIDSKTGNRVKVSVYPGLNEVEDAHWNVVKDTKFAKHLVAKDCIVYGKKVDDQLLDQEPDTKSVSKSEPTKAKTKAS